MARAVRQSFGCHNNEKNGTALRPSFRKISHFARVAEARRITILCNLGSLRLKAWLKPLLAQFLTREANAREIFALNVATVVIPTGIAAEIV